jgi:hypothetical protein
MLTISSNHSHKSLNCPWNFTIRSIVRNSYKRVCNLPLIYNQPTLPIVGLIMGSWLGFIGCPNIVSATVQNVQRIIYQDLSGNKFATVFLAISHISAGVHERLSSIFVFCDRIWIEQKATLKT